jgi:uncharacterized membrane protein (DUF4010 family)
MTLQQTFVSIAVAVAAGILIGAERQQAQATIVAPGVEENGSASRRQAPDFGGIRTFPLIALLGALGALVRPLAGMWLLGGLLLGVIAFVAVSHAWSGRRGDIGISSEVAGLVTYVLGALALMNDLVPDDSQRYLLVGGCAAMTLALLALKQPMHQFVGRISPDDIYATTKFLMLGLIILPVLPNKAFGPLLVLNPFKIGMMILLVAGISFTGYLASRLVGQDRGLLLTGFLGGLVSSTAVTLTYAGKAKKESRLAPLCAVAIVVACSTMFGRVVAVVAVVDRALLSALVWSLGTMAVVGFVASVGLYVKTNLAAKKDDSADEAPSNAEKGGVALRNPFELKQAVTFGLLYGGVLFVAKAAQTYLGSGGLYASAVLAGLTDVDAITLSVTDLHRSGLETSVAATAITLAAVTNTIVKSTMAVTIGGKALGKAVAPILGGALVAGGIAFFVRQMMS